VTRQEYEAKIGLVKHLAMTVSGLDTADLLCTFDKVAESVIVPNEDALRLILQSLHQFRLHVCLAEAQSMLGVYQ
jgi:hypothetical protein